ncbi:MAG: NAD(P)-binding protein [bacterium]
MKGKKIKIAGAGVSGITTALCLAKEGYEVEIYEKNETSGKRFEGDFQGIENWSFEEDALDFLERANIETNFDHPGFKEISFWGPDGFRREFDVERPAFYMVKRGVEKRSLDHGLNQQIMRYDNIKVAYNTLVKPEEVDVVATGPAVNDPVKDGFASGYTFKTDSEDRIVMIADDKYAKDGYSYFLVHNGHGVIATCIFNDFKNLNEYRDKTLKLCKESINFTMTNVKQFGGTGNFFLPKEPSDGKIYVGEANGTQDYLWGFGIRHAMTTGYIAAKSIIDNKDYYSLFKKVVLPRLKTSISNRLLYHMLGRRSYRLFVGMLHDNADPIRFLGDFYRPSLLKKAIYPLARLIYSKHLRDPRKL